MLCALRRVADRRSFLAFSILIASLSLMSMVGPVLVKAIDDSQESR